MFGENCGTCKDTGAGDEIGIKPGDEIGITRFLFYVHLQVAGTILIDRILLLSSHHIKRN